MNALLKVATDKRGFATKLTPVSNGGILRHARSIDDLFNDILNGEQAIQRLLFTAASTLTISSGSITTTLNQHIVAAETGTADDLTTIVVANNKFVFLRADAGDTITLKHGSSNIHIPGGNDIILSGYRGVLLFCENSYWGAVCTTLAKANMSAIVDPGTGDDSGDGYNIGSVWLNTAHDRVWICVDNTATTAQWKLITPYDNEWSIRAAAATAQAVGIAAPTFSDGATGNGNDATDTFLTVVSSTSGDIDGIITASFDLVRPQYDPILDILVKSADTAGRYWMGLTSAEINNSDTLTAGIKFIGFRSSSGWKPVLCDGSTQTDGSSLGSMSATTIYRLRLRVVSSISTVYYSMNGGAEQALTTGFPSASQDLGFCFRVISGSPGTPRTMLFGNCKVGW